MTKRVLITKLRTNFPIAAQNDRLRHEVTGMETKPITICVSSEAAFACETAPAEQRRKLDALLSLKLTEIARARRPLEEIMNEISRTAQERGLTPDILESILDE